jgi:hypothetical protein
MSFFFCLLFCCFACIIIIITISSRQKEGLIYTKERNSPKLILMIELAFEDIPLWSVKQIVHLSKDLLRAVKIFRSIIKRLQLYNLVTG